MNQAELANAAEVSKATVSQVLSGKAVPNADTLNSLAEALQVTGKDLRELHRLRVGADPRERRLDGYSHAALRAARSHPYSGVLPGTTPPLATTDVEDIDIQL